MDIVKRLRESGNKLLETEAKDIQMWGSLKHNKSDLELFLANNVTEIEFRTKDGEKKSIICTSNTPLIKVMAAKKKTDKKDASQLKNSGIKTNDTVSVDTWDLMENKIKTVSIKSWQILNFISITEENILILDEVLQTILGK